MLYLWSYKALDMRALTLSIFLILLSIFNLSVAQQSLTHTLSEEEKAKSHTIGKDFYPTDPPTGEVRNIAEFEPTEGVLVRYPFGIPMTLIAEISESDNVITLVANQSQEDQVISLYSQNGVNLDNCDFIHAATDSYWTRDYGPWFIMVENSEVSIVNFPYNRPRPNDNDVPIQVAQHLDVDLYGMNLIHTGGNWMTDGMHQGAHTDLVLDENPSLSQGDVDQLVEDYLGITSNHILEDPLGEYIKHIDCWGKFLGPDKILIGQVPQSDSRYQDFEDAAAYWANTTSSYGTPYRVYRVFTPGGPPATPYTNSYILNKKVFVPQTGSQWDDEALESYEDAMPGYEIIGIYHNTWENTDALHCRTHEIADREMLYIDHMPLLGDHPVQDTYSFSADIHALSGENIYADSVLLRYRIDGGQWEELVMTSSDNITYTADFEYPGEGFEMMYYIHAADESGRSENHPYIGRWEPHSFRVPAPSAPECVTPSNNSNSASVFTNLLWQDAGEFPATSYRISFGTDNPPTNILHNVVIDDPEYILTEMLDYETEYFWQVTAVNSFGETAGDIWSFITLGDPDEDFESGDFSLFDWTFEDEPWVISESVTRNGIYSAASGVIGDNETSTISITLDCSGFGKIMWWGKTDCEENDLLRFFIDDVEISSLSGDTEWTEFRSSTGPGPHTFTWTYAKDSQNSAGEDQAYIDFLYLPDHESILSVDAGDDGAVCASNAFEISGAATGYTSLLWTTSGDGSFDNENLLSTSYLPGENDATNGIVTLTLTVSDNSGNNLSDDLELTVNNIPESPEILDGPDTVYVFSAPVSNFAVTEIPEASEYIWNLTPDAGIISPNAFQCEIEWTVTEETQAELQVMTENQCGQSAWSPVKEILLIPDYMPGFEENADVDFLVFPNPSQGEITIQFKNSVNENREITLFDAFGRKVYEESVNSFVKTYFISNLSKGMYVLQVRHDNRKQALRVVIR